MLVLQGILKPTLGTKGRKRFKADSGIGEKQGQITTVNYNILTMNIKICVKPPVIYETPSHCTGNICVNFSWSVLRL